MVFSAIKLGFQGSKNFIFFFFVFFREFVPREKGFDNCTPPDFRSCVRRPRYTPVIRNGRISQVNAQNNSRLLFGKHSDRAAGDEKSFDGGIGQIENRLSNASGGKMRKGRLRHRQFIYAGRDESASWKDNRRPEKIQISLQSEVIHDQRSQSGFIGCMVPNWNCQVRIKYFVVWSSVISH